MTTPAWILDIFAAVMLAVAALSAARLVAVRPWRPASVIADTDIAHLLMAIAMAGMLVSSLATLPDAAWEIIFGLLTAWFACRVLRDAHVSGFRSLAGGHCATHLVHSAAMLYMFFALAAPASGGGMGGMGGASGPAVQTLRYPTLALLFALILVGYSVWDIDQLSGGSRRGLTGPPFGIPGAVLAGAAVPAAGAEPAVAAFSGAAGEGGAAAVSRPQAEEFSEGPSPVHAGNPGGILLSSGMTAGCRIAMGVTMSFMLLIMI
jgi:Domain of unknown function (DUF5134)